MKNRRGQLFRGREDGRLMRTYKARQADTSQDKGFPDDFLVHWAWSPQFIRAVSGNRAASAACARQPESLCLTRVAVISENLFYSIHTHTVDSAALVILLGYETHPFRFSTLQPNSCQNIQA